MIEEMKLKRLVKDLNSFRSMFDYESWLKVQQNIKEKNTIKLQKILDKVIEYIKEKNTIKLQRIFDKLIEGEIQ